MGLRGWVRQQLKRLDRGTPSNAVDLVDGGDVSVPVPRSVGLDRVRVAQAWSLSRLSSLFREAAQHPSGSSFQAARVARHRLSSFWMSAPVDQLQPLYEGDFGALQQLLLDSPIVWQELAEDERAWVQQLRDLLDNPQQQSRQLNVFLALLPYTPPGQFSIQNPLEKLPDWLLTDYIRYCEPELEDQRHQPAGLLEPSPEPMDPLTDRRGEEAMVWFRDPVMIERITTLIDAFQVDSSPDELFEELAGLRVVLAQLWLDVEPTQLETLWHTPVGEITRALIQAGLGRRLLDEQDQRARQKLAGRARDLSQPDAPAVILAVMLFYPLERIGFKTTDQLPDWFVSLLSESFASVVGANRVLE